MKSFLQNDDIEIYSTHNEEKSDSSKNNNDKDPKFKIGDIVRISKYENIFAVGYTPNCSEEVLVIKNIEDSVLWTYVETFFGKELQKTNRKEFRVEKLLNSVFLLVKVTLSRMEHNFT